MTIELKLPELGENITSGKVIAVLVNEGETVDVDQSVIEVETDKALIEVPSSVAGTITEILLKPGDDAAVGETILVIEEGEAEEGEAGAEPAPYEETEQTPLFQTPEPPDAPEAEPVLTDAAPAPPDAPEAELAATDAPPAPPVPQSEETHEEEVPAPADASATHAPEASAAAPETPEPPASDAPAAPAPAAPSVHRIAREAGVDIHDVPGSGIGGRISERDVRAFTAAAGGDTATDAPARTTLPLQLPDLERWGETERAPMSGIRRATSENLARAWAHVPHVTQCEKADISKIEELRKRFAPRAEALGGKLTITAILLKVVASALKVFPQFNASVDAAAEEIVYKKYVSVGVAVDTENGLLVPVIRDADRKNVLELSAELSEAAERARARKLAPDDMAGGSITITNLGGFGGTYFTPIVNWPEVAIVGVSRARVEPVWSGEEFEPRLMLPLMVSYDHRLIDGADGVRFLRWVADALEEPMLISLEG